MSLNDTSAKEAIPAVYEKFMNAVEEGAALREG